MGKAISDTDARRDSPSRWKIYAIQIGLVFVSIAMGAVFGFVAALGMGAGSMAPAGAILGLVVGFIVSPFLLFGLYNRDIGVGLMTVFLPTVVASLISGAMMTVTPLAFLVAVFCFIGTTFMARSGAFESTRYPIHCCQHCSYDLTGIADRAPCPECGTPWPECRTMHHLPAGPLNADHPCQQCGHINRTKYKFEYCPGCHAKATPQATEPEDPDHSPD